MCIFAKGQALQSNFYPRPPGGGRRRRTRQTSRQYRISIHALRVEGDNGQFLCVDVRLNFYPRPPGGGRHDNALFGCLSYRISIHALRVEGDSGYNPWRWGWDISIHALRVEGDKRDFWTSAKRLKFLSTPSGWRATFRRSQSSAKIIISIHALRVEGDAFHLLCGGHFVFWISIHALRVEGDSKNGQSFRLFLRKREKNLPL